MEGWSTEVIEDRVEIQHHGRVVATIHRCGTEPWVSQDRIGEIPLSVQVRAIELFAIAFGIAA